MPILASVRRTGHAPAGAKTPAVISAPCVTRYTGEAIHCHAGCARVTRSATNDTAKPDAIHHASALGRGFPVERCTHHAIGTRPISVAASPASRISAGTL